MAIVSRLAALTTLQSAAVAAGNGVVVNVEDLSSLIVEVASVTTGLTIIWEGSLDGGTTWYGVTLANLGATDRARALGTTSVGLYLLDGIGGLSHFRARLSGTPVSGTTTIRARGPIVN